MFVACIMEKGLWFKNVNEIYFHIATGFQCIYWSTHMPGSANPLPILGKHGVMTMMIVFPFQIVGGVAGKWFMGNVFWKQGLSSLHLTLSTDKCTATMNTDSTNGILIETGLVLLLTCTPMIWKQIGKTFSLSQDNTAMVFQSVTVALVVRKYINITGAMMNPLLAVVVEFGCLTSMATLQAHMMHYWAGPMILVLLMNSQITSTKSKSE